MMLHFRDINHRLVFDIMIREWNESVYFTAIGMLDKFVLYSIVGLLHVLENIVDLLKVLRRFTFLAMENAFFSVDSFFLLR